MTDFIKFDDEQKKPIDLKLKRAQSLVGASQDKNRPAEDFYRTPPEATLSLLNVEDFEGTILEPACGDGAISEVLKDNGLDVISTDLIDRGYGVQYDFLSPDYPFQANSIITNPPFNIAEPFIRKALAQTDKKVAMLVKLQFLEGQKRKLLFETQPLKTVYVFSKRVSFYRNGEKGNYSSSMIAFCWVVFEHGYVGAPQLKWI